MYAWDFFGVCLAMTTRSPVVYQYDAGAVSSLASNDIMKYAISFVTE